MHNIFFIKVILKNLGAETLEKYDHAKEERKELTSVFASNNFHIFPNALKLCLIIIKSSGQKSEVTLALFQIIRPNSQETENNIENHSYLLWLTVFFMHLKSFQLRFYNKLKIDALFFLYTCHIPEK